MVDYTAIPNADNDDELQNNFEYDNEPGLEIEEEDDEEEKNCLSHLVWRIQLTLSDLLDKHFEFISITVYLILLAAYSCYFIYAMAYKFGDSGSLVLLAVTVLCMLVIFFKLLRKFIDSKQTRKDKIEDRQSVFLNLVTSFNDRFRISVILESALILGFLLYLVFEIALKKPRNLISLGGMFSFIFIFYIFSYDPSKVNWRPVIRGTVLQFALALLLLRTRWGYDVFDWLGDRVTVFLSFTNAGSKFVFGDHYEDHFVAFKVLPVIVFFSTFVSVLYYLGVVQVLVGHAGRFLSFCLGTSPVESINAAANIFLGQTEAPLLVRPFLEEVTNSELHAIMTGGFATIAGSVMAAYILFGVPANHLLTASVMSAPAALSMAKLFVPESGKNKHKMRKMCDMPKAQENNIIEAASNGASMSINLVANVVVNLIAFIAFLEFLNSILTWCGDRVGYEGLTFQRLCSYVLWPVAFLLGVDREDCGVVAELIGIKTSINEFVAYVELSKYIGNRKTFNEYQSNATANVTGNLTGSWYLDGDDIYLNDTAMRLEKGLISERSVIIATYALCGFSNLSAMGVQLGGLGALAPSRKSDMSKLVFRAMLAGNMACFMTACIAGLLYME